MSAPKKGGCVICGQPKHPQFRPFCSKRCADVDLNHWFSGKYAIPAAEQDDDPDAPVSDDED
jgi:endogenous inhibitor of DNA gyrase (YacG/DUF329 family)